MRTVEEYLRLGTLKREWVDHFLDPAKPSWAKFDPELGYTMNSCVVHDAMDGAYSVNQYTAAGHRLQLNHAGRPCRLNTYGNSFTQCHQVSDGETWQEHLAAHFGEPIRNWGSGGYGVFQAYRRLKREEATALAAPNVILNIWGDDHHRSLMSWRWLSYFEKWNSAQDPVMFHSNPWAHIRFNLGTHVWEERESNYNTPESLYTLCDSDHVVEHFRNDEIVLLMAAERGVEELNVAPLEELASWLGLSLDFRNADTRAASAKTLFNAYAWRATLEVLDRTKALVESLGKKWLIIFSYPHAAVLQACRLGSREHPEYFDWHPAAVRAHAGSFGVPCLDLLPKHLADFACFRLTPEEYIARYYIGHYNPKGNQFFAYSIKDDLKEWLEPRPFTYRGEGRAIDFDQYLPSSGTP